MDTRSSKNRWRQRASALAAVAALLAFAPTAAQAAPAPFGRTPCGPVAARDAATMRLSVVGTHMEDSSGHMIVPYGISLVGGPETTSWAQTEGAAAAQIVAATRYWHVNTVRIQVSEAELFADPTPPRAYNLAFAESVDRLVCLVLSHHAIPVVNDTTLFTAKERGPTWRTVRFWRFIAQRYGNRFPVVFDLFNEPRLTHEVGSTTLLDPNVVWQMWEGGGTLSDTPYVGMQTLVDEIRVKQGVRNIIWAEEPYTYLMSPRSHMDLLPTHLLNGTDIVYAFHKANMSAGSPWLKALRDLSHHGIPLVDSEWSQYAATKRPWECSPEAYTRAPRYLAFLKHLDIGLIAWSLQPGVLVAGPAGHDTVHDGNDTRYTTDPATLSKPSVLEPTYGCDEQSLGQGAGALVKRYFAHYSRRLPTGLFPRLG